MHNIIILCRTGTSFSSLTAVARRNKLDFVAWNWHIVSRFFGESESCTELYRVVQSCTGQHRAVQSCTGQCTWKGAVDEDTHFLLITVRVGENCVIASENVVLRFYGICPVYAVFIRVCVSYPTYFSL